MKIAPVSCLPPPLVHRRRLNKWWLLLQGPVPSIYPLTWLQPCPWASPYPMRPLLAWVSTAPSCFAVRLTHSRWWVPTPMEGETGCWLPGRGHLKKTSVVCMLINEETVISETWELEREKDVPNSTDTLILSILSSTEEPVGNSQLRYPVKGSLSCKSIRPASLSSLSIPFLQAPGPDALLSWAPLCPSPQTTPIQPHSLLLVPSPT